MHVEHPAYVIAYVTEIYDTITCITSIELILYYAYIGENSSVVIYLIAPIFYP